LISIKIDKEFDGFSDRFDEKFDENDEAVEEKEENNHHCFFLLFIYIYKPSNTALLHDLSFPNTFS
jgi:hypothetical protein